MRHPSRQFARRSLALGMLAALCASAPGRSAGQEAPPPHALADSLSRADSAVAAAFAAQIAEKRAVDAVFTRTLGDEMLVRKIAYVVADGKTIPAYLFAPSDSGRRYPTILFVHGGLHGDFGLAHLAQVRALVRAGHVVVAPEYRGEHRLRPRLL